MSILVKVPEEKQERSLIEGRNGCAKLTAVSLWTDREGLWVYINGIGQRGIAVRGGLNFPVELMDEIAEKWLEMRKKK